MENDHSPRIAPPTAKLEVDTGPTTTPTVPKRAPAALDGGDGVKSKLGTVPAKTRGGPQRPSSGSVGLLTEPLPGLCCEI